MIDHEHHKEMEAIHAAEVRAAKEKADEGGGKGGMPQGARRHSAESDDDDDHHTETKDTSLRARYREAFDIIVRSVCVTGTPRPGTLFIFQHFHPVSRLVH